MVWSEFRNKALIFISKDRNPGHFNLIVCKNLRKCIEENKTRHLSKHKRHQNVLIIIHGSKALIEINVISKELVGRT